MGVFIGIMVLVLFILVIKMLGEVYFVFIDVFVGKELGIMSVFGFLVVFVSVIVCLLVVGVFFMGCSCYIFMVIVGVVVGIVIIVGFLSWVVVGCGLLFQVVG